MQGWEKVNRSDPDYNACMTVVTAAGAIVGGAFGSILGPAGTVVLIHCRVVHGSAANYSSRMRPLLLNVYSAADALAMAPAPAPTKHTGELVRGQEAVHVHMEPYPARLPPRWDQVGYRSIFAAQKTAPRPAWID